ncbi:ATP-binding protein [Fervidobacterium thailandense]|uniref:ATP-binding protein n=1 Tax=Fervidobacterium thailandense TaxID=1008305 RepID=A0A1E3G2P0_9BACT|nr:ATP-binding protein [Fervidobacterium thailandense]ODN30432.1 hypothetical protein A4H02_05205 [Fervidobacterium thailandense]
MLFDPRPKVRKEELYDREEELGRLLNTDAPIILLLAPRRLGKTSLLNVFANQLEGRCLIIDCREVFHEQNYSSKNFLDYFTKLVNQNVRKNPLLREIRKVKSSTKNLKIYGLEL